MGSARRSYDVVIVGGAMMGASVAWHLRHEGFTGSVLVLERDPTYETSSTAHTNSCMRQQFSTPLNIKISQYAAHFVRNFREIEGDERIPEIHFQSFGYMYLAADDRRATALREAVAVQNANGAATRMMTPEEVAEAYPFYHLSDVVAASHNLVDEGYFDGTTLFEW
ncbi:MAG: FAD-dependent oxidoreductase, partial [Pseudomonadota bacterium]